MESCFGVSSDGSRLLVESGFPDGETEGVLDVDSLRRRGGDEEVVSFRLFPRPQLIQSY